MRSYQEKLYSWRTSRNFGLTVTKVLISLSMHLTSLIICVLFLIKDIFVLFNLDASN